MIKKDWGVQTDDGREGMMNPGCHTSWHQHSKDTRIRAVGQMYIIEQFDFGKAIGIIPANGLTVHANTPHCLFTCSETVTFKESGTEIVDDITRHEWPEWADKIIAGVRESHGMMPPSEITTMQIPTERRGYQAVSQITNDADVTTSK